MQRLNTLIIFLLISFGAYAQKDTTQLDDVVVTATRTERKMGNVAVPVTLVNKKVIQQMGNLKLQDVLNEQTGLVVVNSNLTSNLNGYPNPFGQGIQMLGLDPSYTAMLLDGEPLVGRNAGILKLGRVAVGNIKQIEIVKGPASSLYGSEAMAGVINIITEPVSKFNVEAQLHQATNNTTSTTLGISQKWKNSGVSFFTNLYKTSGYDLDPTVYGKTVDPYRDVNAQVKLAHQFSNKVSYSLSARMFDQKQDNNYAINPTGTSSTIVSGNTFEKDYTVFSQLKYLPTNHQKIFVRFFYNRYSNNAAVSDDKNVTYDETSFLQHIIKPEIQYEKNTKKGNKYIGGVGAYFETIDASRYSGKQSLQTLYVFSQKEWSWLQNKHTIIAGLRLDKRTDFDVNFSPRLAYAYKPNAHWKITGSVGAGFKAPDFRHMFLNLSNQQIGYSLIGNNILAQQLQNMKANGQLDPSSNISNYINQPTLQPEKSIGFHIGASFHKKNVTITLGLFRNDIHNLIDVYTLAGVLKSNGNNIWSYRNINKVYTQGFELDFKYTLTKNIDINAGFQYIIAKDKDVVANINEGKVYYRDPVTLNTYKVEQSNYFGLPNRSRVTYNAKILVTSNNEKFNAYIRAVYRGKYGVEGSTGKMILSNSNDFVNGFMMLHAATSYSFNTQWQLQVGVDNMGSYTNALQLPNIAGRLFFINVNYSLNNK